MSRHTVPMTTRIGIIACCLLAGMPLMAQVPFLPAQESAEQKPVELEPIVIYGGVATPKMWKVSKGDHVLWVLANATAPAGAKWRFDPVEAHIAESQLVLYPGQLDHDIGFFKTIGLITLVPSALKAAKNPDKKTLKDVLPPQVYARWRVLKTEYVGKDDDIERWRPFIALQMLEGEIDKKFISAQTRPPPPGPALQPLVDKAVKKHKVKVRTMRDVERKIEIKNPRGMLKGAAGIMDLLDVTCLTQRMEYLERKVEYLKQQTAGKTEGKAPANVPDCNEADTLIKKIRSGEIPDTDGIVKMIDNAERQEKSGREQLNAEWVAGAEAALAKNKSTFAVLPMYQLKSATGQIAKLRELGYTVEEPQ